MRWRPEDLLVYNLGSRPIVKPLQGCWRMHRHIDQWNTTRSPEIDHQLTFNKGAKKFQWRNDFFSTNTLHQLDIHIQKHEPLSVNHTLLKLTKNAI